MITVDNVLNALAHVQEPDLKDNLVALGMIKDIVLGINQVSFTVVLTTPACPLKELIKSMCVEAIHTHCGAEYDVQVNLTANVTSNRHTGPVLPGVKNIIAIASGKGGVGKSTLTSNLAIALAQTGAAVGLIDADITGPSIPTMFGAEDMHPAIIKDGERNLMVPVLRHGVKLLSFGFLAAADNPVVWRGPMLSSALRQFIQDTQWGDLDYLLIDLPPGTSDVHLTLVQTVPVTGAIIITTPQKVALADAVKGLEMFKMAQVNVPILGVVENMAYFTPPELPNNKYYIFGKGGGEALAAKYEVPFLGAIPLIQDIRESGDVGLPAIMNSNVEASEAFRHLAEAVARQIAIRNADLNQNVPVAITE